MRETAEPTGRYEMVSAASTNAVAISNGRIATAKSQVSQQSRMWSTACG